MLCPRRAGIRLGQAQSGAALDAGRWRPGGVGHGDGCLGRVSGADHGADRADRGRPRRGCVRHLRHGTGTYTIMAQVAADMLGLALDHISIKLGDSSLPQSPVEGGSWIAVSVSNGIATTARAIRDELLRLAQAMPSSPLANLAPDGVALADGKLVSRQDATRSVAIADAMRHGAVDRVVQEKATTPVQDASRSSNAHSAVFVEVKVDEQL